MASALERRRREQLEAGRAELREAYTPGKPVKDPELFSGRQTLLEELDANLGLPGVHLVLYGERGVGKSSLWRVLLYGKKVEHHQATPGDDFVSIFQRVLKRLAADNVVTGTKSSDEISSSLGKEGVAGISSKSALEVTSAPVVTAALDLNFLVDRLRERDGEIDAIVIDEFHEVEKPAVHEQISAVLKVFGEDLNITIVLVGVAESAAELLRGDKWDDYLGRHLHIRKVPRMNAEEIRGIIDLRERRYGFQFDDDVKDAITLVAAHEPSHAHRLALDASVAWLTRTLAGHVLSGISWALRKLFDKGFDVSKAGGKVELEDFWPAVTQHLARFRNDRGELASRYDDAVSGADGGKVRALLGELADTPEPSLTADDIAAGTHLAPVEISALASGAAKGLVTVTNEGRYALVVRDLGSFAAAERWCSEHTPPAAVAADPG